MSLRPPPAEKLPNSWVCPNPGNPGDPVGVSGRLVRFSNVAQSVLLILKLELLERLRGSNFGSKGQEISTL